MGVCGLVFLLLTRTPLKHRRLRRSSPRSNQTSIRQGDPCTGVRTPPGMERAPLYRYFDDTTPLVPAPACVAAQALVLSKLPVLRAHAPVCLRHPRAALLARLQTVVVLVLRTSLLPKRQHKRAGDVPEHRRGVMREPGHGALH